MIINNPYMPIAMSLRMALKRKDFISNQSIQIIVKEVQMLQSHQITIRQITRSVYTYTTAINRIQPSLVMNMKYDNLGEVEYRLLLEFFESL